MNIEHPHERDRQNALADRYELAQQPEWMRDCSKGVNPYPWTDPRNEVTAREIERQRTVRAVRAKRKERANG